MTWLAGWTQGKLLRNAGVSTLVTAVGCNLLLNIPQAMPLPTPRPPLVAAVLMFAAGAAVVWLILVLVIALLGRLWIAVGFIATLSALLSFINVHKLSMRQEPLYPSDFAFGREAGFLVHAVGFGVVAQGGGLALSVIGLCLMLSRLVRRDFEIARLGGTRRRNILIRVVATACCLSALAYTSAFNSDGNRIRSALEWSGADWKDWSQTENYFYNGFVPSFLYNMDRVAMDPPPGYDRETMLAIATKYRRLAERMNTGRSIEAMTNTNIVIVLSESFSDPTLLPGVKFEEDPIPFTHELLGQVSSAPLLTQSYGGGTANMEFSALTGQSVGEFSSTVSVPYQQLVPASDDYPSITKYLEGAGFRTVAIHPFAPQVYRRNEVYERFGFDSFVDRDEMSYAREVVDDHYISDESAFSEVDKTIRENAEPVFVNLVTMQNHIPIAGIYPDPMAVEGTSSRSEAERVGHYARGLRHTDLALDDWLGRLSANSERTVVLFYGDHQPPIWSSETLDRIGEIRAKRSLMFVWKNFGHPERRDLPVTSPIHFMNRVFDSAGAPVPPFLALLRSLERQIPAMERGLLFGPDGHVLKWTQLSEHARRVLDDYRLVQYDLSVGQRFAAEQMFYPAPQSRAAAER